MTAHSRLEDAGLAGSSSRATVYASIAASIAWLGLLLQCFLSLKTTLHKGQTIADGLIFFFGFFTVLTNIMVGLTLTWPLLARKSTLGQFFRSPFAIAGVAVSITFVALSYHFLLRHVWNPQGAQWLADVTLHYAVPLIFVIYWWIYSRAGTLRWSYPLIWSVYPIVYFLYVLVRGAIVETYPYGFIDVAAIGYRRTTTNAIGLLVAFVILGLVIVGVDRTAKEAEA